MAVLFDSAADALLYTAGAPAADPVAMSCWYYHAAAPASAAPAFWQIVNNAGTQFDTISITSGSVIRITGTGTPTSVDGSTLSTGTWYWLFYRRTGSTHQLYLNGTLDVTRTVANTVTAENVIIGGNTAVAVRGRVAAMKIWTSAVTIENAWNEQFCYVPLRTSDLWCWWRLLDVADLADFSGQGRTLTTNSTPATADGPPIMWAPSARRRLVTGVPAPTTTPVSASDTLAMSLLEALHISGHLITLESTPIRASEALETLVVLVRDADSGAVVAGDAAQIMAGVSATDALALVAQDAASLAALVAAADACAISASEMAALAVALTGTDTASLDLATVFGIAVVVVGDDACVLGMSDTAAAVELGAVLIAATATLGLGLGEVVEILARLSEADTAAINLANVASLIAALSGADAVGLGAAETADLLVRLSTADLMGLDLTEAASASILLFLAVADSLGIGAAEAATLLQSLAVAVADTLGIDLLAALSVSAAVVVAESLPVQTAEDIAAAVRVHAGDDVSLSLAEALAAAGLLTVADAVSLGLVDTVSAAAVIDAADTLGITVAEAFALRAGAVAVDTLGLSIEEVELLVKSGVTPEGDPTRGLTLPCVLVGGDDRYASLVGGGWVHGE